MANESGKSLVCFICGQEIVGEYYYDQYGNNICNRHSNVPLCFCCGRFCDSNALVISPERHICSNCQERQIEMKYVRLIVTYIYYIYEQKGLRFPKYDVTLLTVSEMIIQSNRNEYTYPLGLAERRGENYHVYVLGLLSRIGFVNTLAHEIMHIWQWHKKVKMPLQLSEGLSEFGSYFVMKSMMNDMPTEEARVSISNILNNRDEIYGDGFRYWKGIYDQGGWKAVVNVIDSYKNG